jgi:hypothetical protein
MDSKAVVAQIKLPQSTEHIDAVKGNSREMRGGQNEKSIKMKKKKKVVLRFDKHGESVSFEESGNSLTCAEAVKKAVEGKTKVALGTAVYKLVSATAKSTSRAEKTHQAASKIRAKDIEEQRLVVDKGGGKSKSLENLTHVSSPLCPTTITTLSLSTSFFPETEGTVIVRVIEDGDAYECEYEYDEENDSSPFAPAVAALKNKLSRSHVDVSAQSEKEQEKERKKKKRVGGVVEERVERVVVVPLTMQPRHVRDLEIKKPEGEKEPSIMRLISDKIKGKFVRSFQSVSLYEFINLFNFYIKSYQKSKQSKAAGKELAFHYFKLMICFNCNK